MIVFDILCHQHSEEYGQFMKCFLKQIAEKILLSKEETFLANWGHAVTYTQCTHTLVHLTVLFNK